MTTDSDTKQRPEVRLVDGDVLPAEQGIAVLDRAAVGRADVAVLSMKGPGAIQCIQGVLTNDVNRAGPRGFVWGAVLTPKGMIICDLWVAREENDLTLFVPAHGLEALLATFKRSIPPRLAKVEDRTDETTVLQILGPRGPAAVDRAGLELPSPSTSARGDIGDVAYTAMRPPHGMPFAVQLVCAAADASTLEATLNEAGVVSVDPTAVELARIVSGWPRLGAEIDRKTLPQEARFEELEGVSYTKGCYTGQETVARLHFRGHTNRRVVGLVWDEAPDPNQPEIVRDDRTMGRISSVAWLPTIERYAGLGMLKRKVEEGERVTAGGKRARVVGLPLETVG